MFSEFQSNGLISLLIWFIMSIEKVCESLSKPVALNLEGIEFCTQFFYQGKHRGSSHNAVTHVCNENRTY